MVVAATPPLSSLLREGLREGRLQRATKFRFDRDARSQTLQRQQYFSLGGKSTLDPPVPIPNTEVKLRSAHDTAPARVWENRSPPGDYFLKKTPHRKMGRFLFKDSVSGGGCGGTLYSIEILNRVQDDGGMDFGAKSTLASRS